MNMEEIDKGRQRYGQSGRIKQRWRPWAVFPSSSFPLHPPTRAAHFFTPYTLSDRAVTIVMPTSPPQEGVAENKPQDELEENGQAPGAEAEGAAESSAAPLKRGRGRPKGSKNKKGAPSVGDASTSAEVPKKKRGRPPKEKKLEEAGTDGEPAPKRKRGRPPKNPKPENSKPENPPEADGGVTSGGEGGEPSEKKKRGRPPKAATAA